MKAPVAQQPNETKAPGGRNCEIWKAEYSVQRSAASFRVISLIAAVFLLRPPVLMTIRFADHMHDSYDFERTEAKSSLRGKVIWGVKLNLMEVPWFEHHDASTIITSDFCITNQSYFFYFCWCETKQAFTGDGEKSSLHVRPAFLEGVLPGS